MTERSSCFVWPLLVLAFSCQPQNEEQASGSTAPERTATPVSYALDGTPLYPPAESDASLHRKDSLLRIALTNYQRDSNNLENIIWYGRRLAYLSRYPEAIDVFTRGLQKFPESPELLRHRGHRYVSTRKFDEAIADLSRAANGVRGRPSEIEPDGIPNRLNTPLSTLQFNIWYHLGLAHYLKGEYDTAGIAYDSCMYYSTNPDLLCATTDWYFMTLMRSGRVKEAAALLDPITPDMEVIENDGYLQRLLMYKGLVKPESLVSFDAITEENELTVVTQGYGVAFYLGMQGDSMRSNEILDLILNTEYWSAFGYIAAEADKMRY